MSTDWYFECRSHTPPLRSEAEFTQHTDDGHFREALRLAESRPVDPADDSLYFERNARAFLAAHPACEVGIVNEYGERPAWSSG